MTATDSYDICLCDVFRSPRREGMYLYVDHSEGLDRVPEALLAMFGKPERALRFRLESGRKLARENAELVLRELRDKGYYLQMPPQPGDGSPHQSELC